MSEVVHKQEFHGSVGQVAAGDIYNHHETHIEHQHIQTGQLDLHLSAPPRIRVVCAPGPQHIGDTHKATLKRLVDEIVQLEKAVKKAPKGYATVWKALCAKMRCTSYHLIHTDNAAAAEGWLRQWLGRLSSAKSAPDQDPDWRKRKFAYINVNVRQLDAHARLSALLAADYQVTTLSALSDVQLATVYQQVAGWKRTATAGVA